MASWKEVNIEKRAYWYETSEVVNAGYINRGNYLYIRYSAKWSFKNRKLELIYFYEENTDVTSILHEKDPAKKEKDRYYNSRRRSYNRMKKALEIYLGLKDKPEEPETHDYIIYTGYSGSHMQVMEVHGRFTGKRFKTSRNGISYTVYQNRAVKSTPEKVALVQALEQMEREYKVRKQNFLKAIFDED